MHVEALGGNPPEFGPVPHVPGAPDVGRADEGPRAGQGGGAGKLFGDDLAVAVDGVGAVVFVVFGQAVLRADLTVHE